MPRTREKMTTAESTTAAVRAHVRRALLLLDRDATANAYGILMHPALYAAALHSAAHELTAAAEMIDRTTWPTDSDYDAAQTDESPSGEGLL